MLKQFSWTWVFLTIIISLLFSPPSPSFPPLNKTLDQHATTPSRVLLLTAHPDDECMFFAPTVLALRAANIDVFSLCLSVGNADGLGPTRRRELGNSLDVLDVESTKRWVVDHPDLQDNITVTWNTSVIAATIMPYITQNNITAIFTFDEHGISSHPNHISLLHGAIHALRSLPSYPRLYKLVTVPLLEKYMGPLAPAFATASARLHQIIHQSPSASKSLATKAPATIISPPVGYLTAHRAMRAHQSQLVWFRHLYVVFSRYMWMNDWLAVDISQPV